MYRQCKNPRTNELMNSILRLSDNAFIPFDPANTDYQEFLRWCSEGNEPLPPDEGESN